MRICDVVMNSIWYDPRVNRQIEEYSCSEDVELSCVGLQCKRYDAEKIAQYKMPVKIVQKPKKYDKKLKTPIGKLLRENKINQLVCEAIIAQKPDIIHANDLDALRPAMKAARSLHCKVIYDSHEIFTNNNQVLKKKLYRKYLQWIEKKLIKKCDWMICVSHAAADYFEKKYKIQKPAVITNCALKQSAEILSTQKAPNFEVLNHGSFYAGRGYEICAASGPFLRDYPEIQVVIRGLGSYEPVIRQTIRETGSQDVIRMDPPVTVQELIPMAARSHVGVAITEPICLNFKLSVSNKLFEYAAAGLPVILSDIPEHRYLNEKYHFGVILSEDTPKAFAEAVIRLYTDHQLYQTCRENAIKMSEEINWQKEFQKVLNRERAMLSEK